MIRGLLNNNLQIVKESGLYFLGKLIPGLLIFLSIPLLIRFYGESIYGEYSLVISAILLINTLLTGWINQSFMRFYTMKEEPEKFEYAMFRLLLLCNLFVIIAGDLVLLMLHFDIILVLIFNIVLLTLSVFSFRLSAGQTKFMVRKAVLADTLRVVVFLSSLILGYFIFKLKSADSALIMLLLANILAYFAGAIILRVKRRSPHTVKSIFRARFQHKAEIREIIKYGLPIGFWLIAANLLNLSDRYIIKYFMDFKSVGEYTAIYDTFSRLMTFTFGPILLALQPRVIKLFNEGDRNKSMRIIRNVVLIEIVVFLFALFPVYLLKGFIVEKFIGLSNPEVESLVIPIFIGAFLWTISVLIQKPLELRKKTISMMFAVLAALVINVSGNILFIPKYGLPVAAYTTIIGSIVYLLVILIIQTNARKNPGQ
jgi:O-antigen/teichoic acid export membrane protein